MGVPPPAQPLRLFSLARARGRQRADVEGHSDVAALFRSIGEGETSHAMGHMEYLAEAGDPVTEDPIGDTESNLRAALASEHREWSELYPKFAKVARDEGLDSVAEWFTLLGTAQQRHYDKFDVRLPPRRPATRALTAARASRAGGTARAARQTREVSAEGADSCHADGSTSLFPLLSSMCDDLCDHCVRPLVLYTRGRHRHAQRARSCWALPLQLPAGATFVRHVRSYCRPSARRWLYVLSLLALSAAVA